MPAKGGSASGGKSDLIYPNFSYKVVGILYDVYNELGFGYQEKYYQRAVAIAFRKNKIKYKEQVKVSLKYSDSSIGYYFLDFLLNDKVILEIKRRDYFSKKDIEQVYAYLAATNLKLGILANFTSSGIKYKRILNIN